LSSVTVLNIVMLSVIILSVIMFIGVMQNRGGRVFVTLPNSLLCLQASITVVKSFMGLALEGK
jgi:hypothetical protein